MKRNVFCFLISILLCLSALVSCGQQSPPAAISPFTEAVWESTLDDVCALEGTEYERTASVYGGYSYIFPKEHLGFDGSIQYMFDGEEALVGVAWFHIGKDQEEINTMYEAIYDDASSRYGKEGSLMDSGLYSGSQWELEDRSIILITFSQNDEHAVQISYISDAVNNDN